MRTATPTETGLCHVAWCNGDHLPPTRDYQEHRSTGSRPTPGLYASVSWLEPISAVARYSDVGPYVYFRVGDADVSLSVRQASRVAEIVAEVGQGEAAELLRSMVALVTDGGESRG